MCFLTSSGRVRENLKSQNLKPVPPCACFRGFFSRVLGFPVTMLHTLLTILYAFQDLRIKSELLDRKINEVEDYLISQRKNIARSNSDLGSKGDEMI